MTLIKYNLDGIGSKGYLIIVYNHLIEFNTQNPNLIDCNIIKHNSLEFNSVH